MTRSGKHTFLKRLYSGYVKSSLQISLFSLMFPPEVIIEKDNEMKDTVDLRNGFLLEIFGRTLLDFWVQKRHVLYLLKPCESVLCTAFLLGCTFTSTLGSDLAAEGLWKYLKKKSLNLLEQKRTEFSIKHRRFSHSVSHSLPSLLSCFTAKVIKSSRSASRMRATLFGGLIYVKETVDFYRAEVQYI